MSCLSISSGWTFWRLFMWHNCYSKSEIGFNSYCSWARIFRRLFSKSCTFGSKSGTKSLVRRYQAIFAKTVPEHLKIFKNLICQIWKTSKCSGTVFANLVWYRLTKDLVPLLTQKCTFFLKIDFLRFWPRCIGKKLQFCRVLDPTIFRHN